MTRLKPFTASDTATTTPDLGRPRTWGVSRLSRQILIANLAGLLVLVIGVLVLDEMREGLIDARIANLRAQGELIAGVLEETSTVGSPIPRMDSERARTVMNGLFLSDAAARVQLFDEYGEMITDSNILRDQVRVDPLAPVRDEASFRKKLSDGLTMSGQFVARFNPFSQNNSQVVRTRAEEVGIALLGETVAGERIDENGERVVSVSVPVQHVIAVLGVITVESNDVSEIVAAERRALFPFIIVAILVTMMSSIMLSVLIARPIRSLAEAADQVRRSGGRRVNIPDMSSRRDEIGDLSKSLQSMTGALYERLGAIESFAADVSHEIKNPLTSIRSAVETLPNAKNAAARQKLLSILNSDVSRLDRLITDISASSRLDIDLARARAEPIDLPLFIRDIISIYQGIPTAKAVSIQFELIPGAPQLLYGVEEPLARVLQNLIDNAITFSPEKGNIVVRLGARGEIEDRTESNPIARIEIEDHGPGIPPDNLETVFHRFYTDRPKGQKFGTHSGLGLAIVRQIVSAHKGRISAENVVDNADKITGARFVVELPVRQ